MKTISQFLQYMTNAGKDPATLSSEARYQIRMITTITYALFFTGSALILIRLTQGLALDALVISMAIVFGLINLLSIWFQDHYRLNAHIIVLITIGCAFGTNSVWGGYNHSNFAWFYAIPLIAAMLLTIRAMWGYVLLIAILFIICITLEHMNIIPYYPHEFDGYREATFVNRFGLLLLICIFINAFKFERSQFEKDLKRAEKNAIAATKEKSKLLAIVSHEIRTPLTGVLGMCELLLQTKLEEKQNYYIESINDSGRMLLMLLNDLLDYSKMEAGKLSLSENPFDMRQTIHKIICRESPKAEQKDLEIHTDIPDDFPAIISGDELRTQQILTNLISNAIKFTDEGRVTLKVTHQQLSDKNIRFDFSVKDTGVGISEADQKRMFDTYTQVGDNAETALKGTGLGLGIAKYLIEAMGGKLAVDSEPNKGTTFYFHIVMNVYDQTRTRTKLKDIQTEHNNHHPQGDFADKHILVAEDNSINRALIQAQLDMIGIPYTSVNNGKDALKAALSKDFDLILMDKHMPLMSGTQATREIRKHSTKKIPIIALTADALPGDKEGCLADGMDDYLAKPFSHKDLIKLFNKWLKNKGQDNEE